MSAVADRGTAQFAQELAAGGLELARGRAEWHAFAGQLGRILTDVESTGDIAP